MKTELLSPRPAAIQTADTEASLEHADSPGSISGAIVAADDEDQVLGLQLEIQWARALHGEAETHIFGAMMIALRGVLSTRGQNSPAIDSTRGVNSRGPGRYAGGTGLKAWLKDHAPKVKEATAYRWMRATEGLLQRTGIADAAALQRLLGADADDLPEPERRVQMELFATLEKSTQAELLDAAPVRRIGGKTYERGDGKGERKPASAQETLETQRAVVIEVAKNLAYIHKQRAFIGLKDEAELDGLLDHLETVTEQVRAWKKLTRAERDEAVAEWVASAI